MTTPMHVYDEIAERLGVVKGRQNVIAFFGNLSALDAEIQREIVRELLGRSNEAARPLKRREYSTGPLPKLSESPRARIMTGMKKVRQGPATGVIRMNLLLAKERLGRDVGRDKTPTGIRAFVTDLVKKNKVLTEREVKAAIGKAFKLNPKTISAGVIHDVRRRLGIDRPGAIAYAKAMLKKNPVLEAKKVIDTVAGKFGIRLGPPDVSRLRPSGSKRQRTVRVARLAGKAAASVRRGRPGRPPKASRSGGISVTYQGSGRPEDLAAFFRGLAAE